MSRICDDVEISNVALLPLASAAVTEKVTGGLGPVNVSPKAMGLASQPPHSWLTVPTTNL